MLKIKTYNQEGKELESTILNQDIFNLQFNRDLIHQAIVTQLANARRAIAQTKTRAMVAGSGRKPWRQKGTGRARFGSIRNPIWIGGGVAFGPHPQTNFTKKFPRKMKRLALYQALARRFQNKNVLIINKLDFKNIQTKAAEKFFQSLPDIKGKLLVILAKSNPKVELSMRNLPYVKTILAANLNIIDILSHQWLIIEKEALEILPNTFAGKKDNSLKPQKIISKAKKTSAEKPTKNK